MEEEGTRLHENENSRIQRFPSSGDYGSKLISPYLKFQIKNGIPPDVLTDKKMKFGKRHCQGNRKEKRRYRQLISKTDCDIRVGII